MNNTINTIIKNYPCLSEEQTIQLCERIKNGDNEARNTLALSNVGLIFEALKQMHVSDEDKDDFENFYHKGDVHTRIDLDLLDALKKGGKGYQQRLNQVLR